MKKKSSRPSVTCFGCMYVVAAAAVVAASLTFASVA